MSALTRPVAELEALAARLLRDPCRPRWQGDAAVIQCASQIGSGSLPVESLPSAGIAIVIREKKKSAVQIIAKAFRALPVPCHRPHQRRCFSDGLRCLDDEHVFVAQLGNLISADDRRDSGHIDHGRRCS